MRLKYIEYDICLIVAGIGLANPSTLNWQIINGALCEKR